LVILRAVFAGLALVAFAVVGGFAAFVLFTLFADAALVALFALFTVFAVFEVVAVWGLALAIEKFADVVVSTVSKSLGVQE
jgi:hypothetical protein